ncbi:MAG: 50S ribosomal protein L10 [Nanoarchaeota archaeon]|nr:50S ribosomal protein L10 [Nanoarchaeota archaeon]MBU4117073.1 50S ribosomal protein L10 [Nanoarchaeota archaeon]
MTTKRNILIPEIKQKSVKELSDLTKTKKTILIVSIKDIPASQFQEIGKKLRGKAIVKVPKKNLIFRALDSSKNEKVKELKEHIKDSVAILFSDLDCFELAGELIRSKSPAKAKAGQEAPEDIEIQAGPTELVPGPAISELGALGIQIQIEKGKITIKEPKVIVAKGKKISQAAADLMSKLDIKPFSVGFIPLSAFDTQESKIYLEIVIDTEKTLENLKTSFGKSLAFAIEIGYPTQETIGFLISKAHLHAKALETLKPAKKKDEKVEDKVAKETENKQDNTSENKSGEENK